MALERDGLDEAAEVLKGIMAEVGELDKVAEGQLKAFVTGDPMEFERKFKAPFTARPTARLVLATNNAPQFSDKSDGIWRRMLLLPWAIKVPKKKRVAALSASPVSVPNAKPRRRVSATRTSGSALR